MVIVNSTSAKAIPDSRREKTILVTIKTNVGEFSASSPMGKSRGKHEAQPYKKTIEEDIITIKKFSDYFSKEIIDKFDDLQRIELSSFYEDFKKSTLFDPNERRNFSRPLSPMFPDWGPSVSPEDGWKGRIVDPKEIVQHIPSAASQG